MLLQFLINGLIIGSIYSLVSLGFALVYNTTKIFHIAYAVLYMFSPYMLMSFYKELGWPLLLSFIIAVLITTLLSFLVDRVVYRPLSDKSNNIVLVSSLGVMIVLINLIAMFYGNETKVIKSGISQTLEIGHIIITYSQLTQFIVSLVICIIFLLVLKFTRFGIETRALRDDPELCMIFGRNIHKTRSLLFILSGAFVAIGSNLVALDVGMDPYVGMPMFLNAMVALIIGGVGRFEAPILGGFIIGILQALTVWLFSSRWEDAIVFLLLIVFLLVRPQGIMGEKGRQV